MSAVPSTAYASTAVRYDAVLFDLLSALLDSWSLWSAVAGDDATGIRWREEYLRLTSGAGPYRPYQDLVAESAQNEGLPTVLSAQLIERWEEVMPWPEAPGVVADLGRFVRVGVVTNCSEELGARAAARVGAPLDPVLTAEAAGAYKPDPVAYRAALDILGVPAERVLFVAGSRSDLAGARRVGMPVWWHNRRGVERGDAPAPIAEHRSLTFLPLAVVGRVDSG